VYEHIQANPKVTLSELEEHLESQDSLNNILLETLKYILNSPAYFESKDNITWKQVQVPVRIKCGTATITDRNI
jgi:hypothetical protein